MRDGSSRISLENERGKKRKNKRNAFYCLLNLSRSLRIPTSGAIPRVHKYLPSILNGHISWGGKKSERPSEIQRLNPSLGSRQYSERSIKACLPDVPFRSSTYTSIELLPGVADITHRIAFVLTVTRITRVKHPERDRKVIDEFRGEIAGNERFG